MWYMVNTIDALMVSFIKPSLKCLSLKCEPGAILLLYYASAFQVLYKYYTSTI